MGEGHSSSPISARSACLLSCVCSYSQPRGGRTQTKKFGGAPGEERVKRFHTPAGLETKGKLAVITTDHTNSDVL